MRHAVVSQLGVESNLPETVPDAFADLLDRLEEDETKRNEKKDDARE